MISFQFSSVNPAIIISSPLLQSSANHEGDRFPLNLPLYEIIDISVFLLIAETGFHGHIFVAFLFEDALHIRIKVIIATVPLLWPVKKISVGYFIDIKLNHIVNQTNRIICSNSEQSLNWIHTHSEFQNRIFHAQ